MTTEVNTNVPLDYDAGAVKALAGYGEDTAAMLGPTETALSVMGEAIDKTKTARSYAERNGAWPKDAKIVHTHVLAEQLYKRAVDTTFKARAKLEGVVNAMEEALSEPISAPGATAAANEIRAHVKGLKTGERSALINTAIKEGDVVTMSSILSQPHYLSGLDKEMHTILAREWHCRMKPDVVKRLDLARAADAMLVQRLGRLRHHIDNAVGVPLAQAAELRERQREAERAFMIGDA